ncbi:TPR repeat-containing protein [Desulfomicrobium apsheronum]|uniref:TPR repeat-containing protein n=1 Tax=Desulfomicrobium apsheronum TaxID=52560 RepID=A0A1I3T2U1_9BACT|nr:tetratricopeptide repeat protein [Desulfomicrobium apsheronum]MDY0227556.1 tetratricopeptide repeat protein [Desulfomicrobium apsheronum]SFJ64016.1 TPR repeat-containing protein [Desulfomicrobium apsheronum]
MAKSSAKQQVGKKNNALVYGIVILMAGALIGVAFSTAFHSTKGQGSAPVQSQGNDMLGQIKIYSDRVALNPQDVNAWITLGNLYFDTGQPAKSVEAYSRSLEISPGNPNVLTDMGVMHRSLGEFQKALDAFAKAIAVDPGHETARMNTGIVLLYDLGDKEGAIAAWQDLVRVNPRAVNANGTPIADILREMTGQAPGTGGGQKLLAPLGNPAN